LLALLIGSAIALWIIVRPPGSGSDGEAIVADVTPSPAVTRESTPENTATRATSTPRATSAPTDTPGAEEVRTYVVQEGDNLLSIAERTAPPGVPPAEYADQIAFASGLSSSDDIAPGDVLVLP
jgi:hypothetical protein